MNGSYMDYLHYLFHGYLRNYLKRTNFDFMNPRGFTLYTYKNN